MKRVQDVRLAGKEGCSALDIQGRESFTTILGRQAANTNLIPEPRRPYLRPRPPAFLGSPLDRRLYTGL